MNSANNVWDVFVLEYARSHNQPWVDLVSGMYKEGGVDLPFSFILARSGARNVLVDTGFMQGEGCSSFPQKFGIPRWISPVAMIEHAGLSADAITDIVLTHAHFDHMGSIGQFRNARLYIQKSELLSWYEAIALPKRYGYLTAIIDPQNLKEALDASIEHRVTLIDGDKDNILPGLHVRLGSGHTIGQQIVILETARPAWSSLEIAFIQDGSLQDMVTTASTCPSTTRPAAYGSSLRPSTRSMTRLAEI